MSVFEHSRAVNNQTMCNDIKFDALGNQKLSTKQNKVPLSQQNTIDRRSASNQNDAFRDVGKIYSKLEKVSL